MRKPTKTVAVLDIPTCPPWHADCWLIDRHLKHNGPVPVHHHGPPVALLTADTHVPIGVRWEHLDGSPAACVVDVDHISAPLNAEELSQVAAALVLAWARIIAPTADQTAAVDVVLTLLRGEALDLLEDQRRAERDDYGQAEVADDAA